MIIIRFFILYIVLFVISACTAVPPIPDDTQTDQGTLAVAPRAEESADHWLQRARLSTGSEQEKYLLRATELFIKQGDYSAARASLANINIELADADTLRAHQIHSAEIALAMGEPRLALTLLPFASILPTAQQIKIYQIRAQAFLHAGYPVESSKTRVQMEALLSDEVQLKANHQSIWESLSLLPETTLNQLSQTPLHAVFLGWVELAKVAKRGQIDWQYLQQGIIQWRKHHPRHPAAKDFINALNRQQTELLDQPSHIAVMLPLSGAYAQIAAAIRDGFMSAYYQHPDKNLRPQITFIDTSNEPAIWNSYKKAIHQGADFIVGPFLKSAVNILAQSERLDIPTLTLNYSREQNSNTENLFQFGLLPEDEAHQIAELAFRQNKRQATVLIPEGEWGERIHIAFQQRFEELGGSVINVQTYTPAKNDFRRPIQQLLNISQSISRHSRLKHLLNTDLKFTPYRRQDVDMIFIAATPRDARQLKPQFKFHYAGELPVYATSHAYTGKQDKNADRDIDELYYCDMPWILSPDNKFKQSLNQYWPEQQHHTRLFALGVDTYNLIPFLARLQAKSYERFSGQTGNIYIDPFNRLHRELLWAQFIRGVPTLIDINSLLENSTLETGLLQQ
jgi:hypothetical protein